MGGVLTRLASSPSAPQGQVSRAPLGGQPCALGVASESPGSAGMTEFRANAFSLLGKQLMGVSTTVTAKRQLVSQEAGSTSAMSALPQHWRASRS